MLLIYFLDYKNKICELGYFAKYDTRSCKAERVGFIVIIFSNFKLHDNKL